jgi:hypothetical protein
MWYSENDINFKYETYVVNERMAVEQEIMNPVFAAAL